MADDEKSLIKAQFGRNAAHYATSAVHAKGVSLARLVEMVSPQKEWIALDVATGAGHTAAAFAPHVGRVIASDITPEMLGEARKLATDKGFGNMETAVADAEALPFGDGTFNLVTCRIAPHHFGDVPRFVAEAWRVLKPGGVFALVDNVSPGPETTPEFAKADLRDAAISYNAFEKVRDPSHGRALVTEEWREIAGDTGFQITHVEHQTKAMDFDGWCRNMSVPAETVPRLRAMLDEARPALKAFLEPKTDDGRVGFRLYEMIMVGRKAA